MKLARPPPRHHVERPAQRRAGRGLARNRPARKIIATSLNRVNPDLDARHAGLAAARTSPQSWPARKRLYLAKDYLRSCLTGTWETDYSDAIGALLADNDTKGWSLELGALIGLGPCESCRPSSRPSRYRGHASRRRPPRAPGLAAGHAGRLRLQRHHGGVFRRRRDPPGIGAVKLATAGVLFLATDGPERESADLLLSAYRRGHVLHRHGHQFLRLGASLAARPDVRRRRVRGMDALAGRRHTPGARRAALPPLSARRTRALLGPAAARRFHRPDDLPRPSRISPGRLYEGIAFSIRDLLEAARALGLEFGTIRLMGGGARSACWRQIIADVTGLTIERTEAADASFGAALLAGIGTGVFASPRDSGGKHACGWLDTTRQTRRNRQILQRSLFGIYKDAQAALAPLNHRLHALVRKKKGSGSFLEKRTQKTFVETGPVRL